MGTVFRVIGDGLYLQGERVATIDAGISPWQEALLRNSIDGLDLKDLDPEAETLGDVMTVDLKHGQEATIRKVAQRMGQRQATAEILGQVRRALADLRIALPLTLLGEEEDAGLEQPGHLAATLADDLRMLIRAANVLHEQTKALAGHEQTKALAGRREPGSSPAPSPAPPPDSMGMTPFYDSERTEACHDHLIPVLSQAFRHHRLGGRKQ